RRLTRPSPSPSRAAATATRDAGREARSGDRRRGDALQALDHRAQEHLVEAQLARGRRLLEQRRADADQRDRRGRADRRGAARAAHVARLAEAVARRERAGRTAARLHADLARHDDVEAVVELALADDLVARLVVPPLARAEDLPDLRMREVVEEAQLAEQIELLLLVDPIVLAAERLIDARQGRRELETALVALRRLLLQSLRDHLLELLGDILAQRMDRRRRRVDDLMQQLAQAVRAERPEPGQELVHHRAERV